MTTPAPRALTVGATAWSLIVLGVLCVLFAPVVGLFAWMLDALGTDLVLSDVPNFAMLPPAMQWSMRHLGGIAIALLVIGVVAIPLGIAMKQRREWARAASVRICWALAVLHVIAVPWQWLQIAAWRDNAAAGLPDLVGRSIQNFYWPIQITNALTTLALASAFAWTAWKLARPDIRAEFRVARSSQSSCAPD